MPQYMTPWQDLLDEGTYTIEVPATVVSGGITYTFLHWEDGTTNRVRQNINLLSDMILSASYEALPPVKHTLTINTTEGGTTYPSPGLLTIVEGQSQQVIAIPRSDLNYRFLNWLLDNTTRTENPILVTMDRDHSLTARFEYVLPPPLKATLSGTVKDVLNYPIADVAVICDGYADATRTDGTWMIPDIPAAQYVLSFTKQGYETQTLPIDVSAGGSFGINVTLQPQQITIALVVNPPEGGTTTPAVGSLQYNLGDTAEFAAQPSPNYTFSHWTLNGLIYTDNPLSLLIAEAMNGKTLTAVFIAPPGPAFHTRLWTRAHRLTRISAIWQWPLIESYDQLMSARTK